MLTRTAPKEVFETINLIIISIFCFSYGDIVPGTVNGKLLGAACALMGVLLLSLPVPIIERKVTWFT